MNAINNLTFTKHKQVEPGYSDKWNVDLNGHPFGQVVKCKSDRYTKMPYQFFGLRPYPLGECEAATFKRLLEIINARVNA